MEGTPAPNGTTGYLPIVAHRPVKEGYLQRVQSAPDIKPIELAIQHVQRFDPGSVLIHYMEELLGKHADLRREIEETLYQAMRAVTSNDWREQGTLPSSLGLYSSPKRHVSSLVDMWQAHTVTCASTMRACGKSNKRIPPQSILKQSASVSSQLCKCAPALHRDMIRPTMSRDRYTPQSIASNVYKQHW